MKILVIGTWKKEKAKECWEEANKLGELLAKNNHILVSGGGTGISELVVNSYKKNKGKKYIAYFPSKEEMEKVGEEKGPEPDKIVETNVDYPERNIIMVKNCEGIIALHGGLGTLTEIIHAVKDYNKKVSVIDKGELASLIKLIPELKEKVFLTSNVKEALNNLK
ncbi:MAG: hypothetical protein UW68_C0059G0003 [Candidatus Collierbacteria bacterium GW2011_GWB1_44_6]|uniref:Rossmann fold nucleotide-binding protein n=1 Tax=Candidatus Collierbacteria bacterium GW2011_GWB1_44_6 TaxID=1618384 RepID=A0A0G1JJA0_9BACT|nr:MAG: hypothetical protein UW68_C0059G0003 [Candidatus Collierbacteria bacterium GW2011_GWB1_44_6]